MSGSTENSAADPMCDRALDYAYGELQGADASGFEAHLKDCAKCQRELSLMKRVRSAVRTVLPMMEPPQAATGALHAQLLHAAAQRRPPRTGKVLQFARRVVSHPGYAAAAGLLIIGGAIGLQFARGGLQMPMKTAAAPPVMAEGQPVVAAKPEPAIGGENAKDELKQDEGKKKLGKAAVADDGAPDVYLRRAEPAAPKPAMAHHASAGKPAASPKTSSPDDSGLVYDVKMGPNTGVGRVTGQSATPGSAGNGAGSGSLDLNADKQQSWRGGVGSLATKGGNANYRDQPQAAPQQAPAPRKRAQQQPPAGSFAESFAAPAPPATSRGYAQAPAPAAQPAPSWNAPSPPPPAELAEKAPEKPAPQTETQAQNAAPAPEAATVQAPAQNRNEEATVNNLARSADALRRKAEELATSGRCDDAVKLYQELEKQYPTFVVSPRDRLPYVRCLRVTGHEQMANDLEQRFDNANQAQQRMPSMESPAPMPAVHAERASKMKAKPAKKSRAADDATLAPAKK
jgi:hypothetical protein